MWAISMGIVLCIGLVTTTRHTLQGYNCEVPLNIRAHQVQVLKDCEHQTPVQEIRQATFQILQQNWKTLHNAWRCTLLESEMLQFCGVWDHTTLLGEGMRVKVPTPVSLKTCHDWVENKKYQDNLGQIWEINPGQVFTLAYEEKGKSFIENEEVKCIGEKVRIGDKIVSDAVKWKQVDILVEEVILEENLELKVMTQGSEKLPCLSHEGGCLTGLGTYLWNQSLSSCALQEVRSFTAVVGKTNDVEVAMSADSTFLRFVLESRISMCGRVIATTNHPGIFLLDVEQEKNISTKMHPSQIQMHTFINTRSDALYHTILLELEKQINEMLRKDCELKARQEELHQWLQWKLPATSGWAFHNGTFAFSSGETIYLYDCQSVVVLPRETKRCFENLPIFSNHSKGFLTPLTRKVVFSSSPVPCTSTFMGKYHTLQGDWISATPKIVSVSGPTYMGKITGMRANFTKEIDWARSGLYEEEQFKNSQRLEFENSKVALIGKLTIQTKAREDNLISPTDVFPASTWTIWEYTVFGKIIYGIKKFGEIVTPVTGVYLIYKFIVKVGEMCFLGTILRATRRALLWAFCPIAFLFRFYNTRQQAGNHDVEQIPMVQNPI